MDVKETVDAVLAHHGVKGQRWGVRRRADGTTVGKPTAEAHKSEDASKADSTKAKIKEGGGTHTVSNAELQHLVNRMNLEQQFSRLSSSKQESAGKKFAKEILVNVAKQQVTKLASDHVTKLVGAALK